MIATLVRKKKKNPHPKKKEKKRKKEKPNCLNAMERWGEGSTDRLSLLQRV
jgi:hypothetical protein